MADPPRELDWRAYLKLVAIGGVIGIPAALLASVFRAFVHDLEHWLWQDLPEAFGHSSPPWYLVIGLPVVGACIVFAARLVEAGVVVFRRFVVAHPSLFVIGFQQLLKPPGLAAGFRDAAADSYAGLKERVARLGPSRLDGRSVQDAAVEFHALCEGLAALELRGLLPDGREEDVWRSALGALVRGFSLRPS